MWLTGDAFRTVAAVPASIRPALPLAETARLVTFGIVPTRPDTGYGYIERGAALGGGYAVARFVEKPDLATARDYLDSGDYFWNSGMFLFRAGRYLAEMERFRPDILAAPSRFVAKGRVKTSVSSSSSAGLL